MIGHKRRRRRRHWLLAMAILPQLASLAAMAGMLWAVKIKDVISAPAAFGRESGRLHISFDISAADRPKLQVGSVIHGAILDPSGQGGPAFSGQVIRIRVGGSASTRLPWRVDARLTPDTEKRPEAFMEPGHPVSVAMWTRTRRALDVVLSQANFSGIAGSAPPGNLSSGIPQ